MAIFSFAGSLLSHPALRDLSPAALALLVLSLAWLSWYIWNFTIVPLLKPDEPRYLPYWVPCECAVAEQEIIRNR